MNAPIRLSYHRDCHYNSLVDPYKATIGVGLGLPGFSPGSADRSLLGQAVKASESDRISQSEAFPAGGFTREMGKTA